MAGTARGFTWVELLLLLFVAIVVFIFVFPFFVGTGHHDTRWEACTNNQRQIAVGIQIYAQDNSERMPTADKIWPAIQLAPACFKCPTRGIATTNAYAYNINLSSRKLGDFFDPTN